MADLNTLIYELIFPKLFECNRMSLLHPDIWWFEWVGQNQGDEEWREGIEEVSRYGHMALYESLFCVYRCVYSRGCMCGLALNELAK